MQTPSVQEMLTRNDGLAARLKRARGAMLAKELAERANWPQSKISKIEGGRQLPSPDDLELWAGLTGTDEITLNQWRAMLVEAHQARRDWAQQVREGHTGVQNRYNQIINDCTDYRFFETTYIPRFFQVPGYTRAVLTESRRRLGGDDDIEQAVLARQASVAHLYDPTRTFQLMVTEPVLRWRPQALPTAVHRQQLDRLLSVIGLENVRFGILPLDAPIAWWPQNAFELYGDVGFVEGWFSEQQLLLDEVEKCRALLDELWPSAVTGADARELIMKILADIPY